MMYTANSIRNVCLLGHSGSGKTALAESLLYMTGVIDRIGKNADGNTVCDYDPEEIRRNISISSALVPLDYKGARINLLDTPGGFDFSGAVVEALRAADAAIIVCSAKDGITVGFEKAWKYCRERNMPCFIYISKVDEDNSDYNATFNALRERYGNRIAPLVVPIWDGNKKVTGIIDVLNKRAYEMQNLKRVEIEVPEGKDEVITEFNDALKESVAETSEDLMDKFFGGEGFTYAEMIKGLHTGVLDNSMFPVFCGSGVTCLGSLMLMDHIIDLLPNPVEGNYHKATAADGTVEEFVVSPGGVPSAFVFKTVSDQYGKYSYVKVLSGEITSDTTLVNARTGETEKLGRLYSMCGKKATEVKMLTCGDIGAIGKMDKVRTGDTLCDPRKVVSLKGLPYPPTCYSMAISPKTKGQEEKVASGLNRLNEEDPSFTLVNNAETHQMVLSGVGDQHLDVLVSKLKTRFGVDAELSPAKIAYREKIKKTVQAHGRHKKQTGGSGQFGDVWIRFEPQDIQDDLIFDVEVVGGAVPKNFNPAVEKGLQEAVLRGPLAGYPMVGLKGVLYDGSYHPVDSNEMAFKLAAILAFKEAMPNAAPTLLEPVGALAVTVPESYVGDVMGDLSKRRGRPLGMTPDADGNTVVEAEVPMAEMSSYAIDLRAMTQARGSFTLEFVRYEEVPKVNQAKIIEEASKED
ncbi:MAG: elongation factor G [Oscillospiraceae bacterium]|nr:elongation factor G [Oscillospiraceae bacterium]